MPGHVLAKEPAKSPYMIEKVKSGASDVLKPQSRKIESTAPVVEMRIPVVTCHMSTIVPIVTESTTAGMLIRIIGRAETVLLKPSCLG